MAVTIIYEDKYIASLHGKLQLIPLFKKKMNKEFKMLKDKTREDWVREFDEISGQVGVEFNIKGLQLRSQLILEESEELLLELAQARIQLKIDNNVSPLTIERILKEMSDLQVVLSGAAVQFRQLRNLQPAFVRVCESNLSKLGDDGKFEKREDGKILKGDNYIPPDLKDLI